MTGSTTSKQGGTALAVSIKGLRTARKELEIAISDKQIASEPFKEEMHERGRVSRKLIVMRRRKALYDAGGQVVSAPSVADINAVKQLIKQVEADALRGAAWRAGFKVVKTLATSSGKLGGDVNVKKT